jgi:integrase
MFLSKRSNGLYYIFYNQQNGKRTCKSTKCRNKSTALIFFRNFSTEQVQPVSIPIVEITLKNFSEKYIEYSKIYHTPKTTLTYKTTFNKMLDYFGDISLSEFNKIQIEDFITHRIKTGSVYCGRKDIVNIKASFKWAVNHKFIKSSPADDIKKVRAPEKLPKYFSEAEYEKLLSVIDCQIIKGIVQLALNTGLRQAEILDLRYSQIDIDKGIIILNNQNHITKSKKIRLIPLNKVAKEVLKNKASNCVNDYVFKINNIKVNQDYLIHKFKKFVIAANINPDLNFHSLRHTFASWLVQRGVSIYEVSKLLGHSDIKVTEIYSHLRAEDLRESVNKLNGLCVD